jgi:hypothetical protein
MNTPHSASFVDTLHIYCSKHNTRWVTVQQTSYESIERMIALCVLRRCLIVRHMQCCHIAPSGCVRVFIRTFMFVYKCRTRCIRHVLLVPRNFSRAEHAKLYACCADVQS